MLTPNYYPKDNPEILGSLKKEQEHIKSGCEEYRPTIVVSTKTANAKAIGLHKAISPNTSNNPKFNPIHLLDVTVVPYAGTETSQLEKPVQIKIQNDFRANLPA